MYLQFSRTRKIRSASFGCFTFESAALKQNDNIIIMHIVYPTLSSYNNKTKENLCFEFKKKNIIIITIIMIVIIIPKSI